MREDYEHDKRQYSDAWHAGWDAAMMAAPDASNAYTVQNPFPINTADYHDWKNGWFSAMDYRTGQMRNAR